MKLFFLSILLFFSDQLMLAQCSDDVILSSQAEIDNFSSNYACTSIEGNLHINGNDITDLTGLETITAISGSLVIDSTQLSNLEAFPNLNAVGEFIKIQNNDLLLSVAGFNQVTELGKELTSGGILIKENDALINIAGFESLKAIHGGIEVANNNHLEEIAFPELEVLWSHLSISNNPYLISIDHFDKLAKAWGDVEILSNLNLETINTFSSLTEINGNLSLVENDDLSAISGFSNLEFVGEVLLIRENANLSDLSVFDQLRYLGELHLFGSPIEILEAFPNLTRAQVIYLTLNNQLEEIRGFDQLQIIGNFLSISGNSNLKSILGMAAVHTIGHLNITQNATLTDFSGFDQLQQTGLCKIAQCNEIEYLNVFPNLEKAGEMVFSSNNKLRTIAGFPNLQEANQVRVLYNPSLISMVGFLNVKTIGTLEIYSNDFLKFIHGFNNLDFVGWLRIQRNGSLKELDGFPKIRTINYLHLVQNSELESIEGFDNLRRLRRIQLHGNTQLSKLPVFSQFIVITEWITIEFNSILTDCCPILCWKASNDSVTISLRNNSSFCNSIEEIEADCSFSNCPAKEPNLSLLNAYPIPSNEELFIDLETLYSTFESLRTNQLYYQVWNLNGQLIDSKELPFNVELEGDDLLNYPQRPLKFDVRNYQAGIYFLKIIHPENGKNVTVRFVKQ